MAKKTQASPTAPEASNDERTFEEVSVRILHGIADNKDAARLEALFPEILNPAAAK